MRWALAVVALAVLVAPVARGEMDDDALAGLAATFRVLSESEDAAATDAVMALLADERMGEEDWRRFFEKGFTPDLFTQSMTGFWDYAIREGGEARGRTAFVAALCACDVLADGLAVLGAPREEDYGEALDRAIVWLQAMAQGFRPADRAKVFGEIRKSLVKLTVRVVPEPGQPPVTSVAWRAMGMQLALAVAEYAPATASGREEVADSLLMMGAGKEFWVRHGVFLFDSGKLDLDQLNVVRRLFAIVPGDLHGIVAVVVQGDSSASRLRTAWQVLAVEPIPMGVMTDPGEFTGQIAQPVAPLFIIATAEKMVRAIQDVQFAARPELGDRLEMLLANAGDRKERYLRRTVPPGVYLNNPGELMPSVGFLWFIDSAIAFRHAMALFEVEQHEAADSVLLFADMMSGGGNSAPMFFTTPDGIIDQGTAFMERSYLERARFPRADRPNLPTEYIPVNIDVVTGIDVGRGMLRFRLDDHGMSIRLDRRQ